MNLLGDHSFVAQSVSSFVKPWYSQCSLSFWSSDQPGLGSVAYFSSSAQATEAQPCSAAARSAAEVGKFYLLFPSLCLILKYLDVGAASKGASLLHLCSGGGGKYPGCPEEATWTSSAQSVLSPIPCLESCSQKHRASTAQILLEKISSSSVIFTFCSMQPPFLHFCSLVTQRVDVLQWLCDVGIKLLQDTMVCFNVIEVTFKQGIKPQFVSSIQAGDGAL